MGGGVSSVHIWRYRASSHAGASRRFSETPACRASRQHSDDYKCRVRTASVDNPGKTSAKVLIAIRPPSPDDPPEANDIGVEQLKALGGVLPTTGRRWKVAIRRARTSG